LSAPSSRAYQRLHGLPKPMDYTERDFVALAAWALRALARPLRCAYRPKAWLGRPATH